MFVFLFHLPGWTHDLVKRSEPNVQGCVLHCACSIDQKVIQKELVLFSDNITADTTMKPNARDLEEDARFARVEDLEKVSCY